MNVHPTLSADYELIVIGGGITGAGILREATRAGLKTLLVEQRDFAWGTSSRSSKLVHGGLRYLKQGNFGLTRESVLERQRLLCESQNLVRKLPFLTPTYRGMSPGAPAFGAGITIYNLLSGHWRRMRYSPEETLRLSPHLTGEALTGGLRYMDARADDARLVLRLIFESRAQGAHLLNHTRAGRPERDGTAWRVPLEGAARPFVRAPVVVNATGIWVNGQRAGAQVPLRPLRGIHLVFPAWRLPTTTAVTLIHPRDHRPVFVLPWEGTTLFGTTDLDHGEDIHLEPHASEAEIRYLMEALQAHFPSLELGFDDIVSTFAGVRPVISTGKVDPSKESREHAIWDEQGLLSITGGKLTTFRVMAAELLERTRPYLRPFTHDTHASVYDDSPPQWPENLELSDRIRSRLHARYGPVAGRIAREVPADELRFVPGSETLWAELRHGARHELVEHLDDLMLRRVRLGQVLPDGASDMLARVLSICEEELGWDSQRRAQEEKDYRALIERCYSLPKSLRSQPGEVALTREVPVLTECGT